MSAFGKQLIIVEKNWIIHQGTILFLHGIARFNMIRHDARMRSYSSRCILCMARYTLYRCVLLVDWILCMRRLCVLKALFEVLILLIMFNHFLKPYILVIFIILSNGFKT